jgi:hypothetical protein
MRNVHDEAGTALALGRAPEVIENEVGGMWNLLNCYLSGRHDFGVSCAPGAIFLRCTHCGRRSPGWAVDTKTYQPPAPLGLAPAGPIVTASHAASAANRGIRFDQLAAR